MYEKEEFKQELEAELQWARYRRRMLDIIEEKLLLMKKMAETVKKQDFSEDEIRDLNNEINNLSDQVRALDKESRKVYDSMEYE